MKKQATEWEKIFAIIARILKELLEISKNENRQLNAKVSKRLELSLRCCEMLETLKYFWLYFFLLCNYGP